MSSSQKSEESESLFQRIPNQFP